MLVGLVMKRGGSFFSVSCQNDLSRDHVGNVWCGCLDLGLTVQHLNSYPGALGGKDRTLERTQSLKPNCSDPSLATY